MSWAPAPMLLPSLVLPVNFLFSDDIYVMVRSLIPANVMSPYVNLENAVHAAVSSVVISSPSTLMMSQRMTLMILYVSQVLIPKMCLFSRPKLGLLSRPKLGLFSRPVLVKKNGQIIEHVFCYGFVSESMENRQAVGRAWSVHQPAAKKAVRGIRAATEIRTSVQRVDVLSVFVPLALGWIRQGCPEEDLASALLVATRSQIRRVAGTYCRYFCFLYIRF